MDVDGALVQPLPNILCGEPTAGEVGEDKADHRERLRAEEPGSQAEYAAEDGGGQLGLPFVDLLRLLKKLDVALDDFGPGDVAPAPELRRGGTGDAGDGGGVGLLANGDLLTLDIRKRLAARLASGFAGQEGARMQRTGLLGFLDRSADALSQVGNIGLAERGDRNGMVRLINRHRFERGVFGQGLGDGPREELPRVWVAHGARLGRRAHSSVPRSQYCHDRRGMPIASEERNLHFPHRYGKSLRG